MNDTDRHQRFAIATAEAERFICEWSVMDGIPEQSKETLANAGHVLFAQRHLLDDNTWLIQLYNTLFAAWNLGRADGEEIEPR